MANTKGKIIIASGIIVIAGITSAIIFSHYRKKKILNEIYDAINDTKSETGQQALLNEENQLLGSNAFDPNFHKGKGTVKPDMNLLMPTKRLDNCLILSSKSLTINATSGRFSLSA